METERQSDEDEIPSVEVVQYLEEVLTCGKMLAGRLDESLRVSLDVPGEPEGIDDLRHEFRHAPGLVNATVAELRCANAYAFLVLVFETLVFQEEEGELPLVLYNEGFLRVGGKQYFTREYLFEKVHMAISCFEEGLFPQQTAEEVLRQLIEMLSDQTLSIRHFTITVVEGGLRMEHDGK